MFSTNDPPSAAKLLRSAEENGVGEQAEAAARDQPERGGVNNVPEPCPREGLPVTEGRATSKAQHDKCMTNLSDLHYEKSRDGLPRLAPVKIPSAGTKWEYYSGASPPHETHSPDEIDTGESSQGPTLAKDKSGRSLASGLSTGSNFSRSSQGGIKRKRSLPGTPDPNAEVIALSPKTLLATNRFVCEICNKGFQRDQNLQLHRRGHNVPWKLRARPPSNSSGKRVYVCPEPSCVHHDPRRALGDLTGIKKHYSRKHGEKRWKCDKCGKKYAVEADWKAHAKTCGPKQYVCDCGTIFTRRETFATHRACCQHVSESIQAQGQLSSFAPVSGGQMPSLQLPPTYAQRPVIPRRLPPPAPVFSGQSAPQGMAHIGQSHDGTPLLISIPARVAAAGQSGMMADINLAAHRGMEHCESLQLLPLSGSMWGQRPQGTPPPAASGPLQTLWVGSRPQTGGLQHQPLQPLAIPGRNGGIKAEIQGSGNGFGEMGQNSEAATSPLGLGFADPYPHGQQTMLAAPQAGRAASPLLQPLPVSPRLQTAVEQTAGDAMVAMLGGDSSAAAFPSAAAAAAAVAAANAGHQVTIEVTPPPAPSGGLPSPRDEANSMDAGAFGVMDQSPVVLPSALAANPGPMSAASLQGGELSGLGLMEQQAPGGALLLATAQVGERDQAVLMDGQQAGGDAGSMLVGGREVVGNQEGVFWAKVGEQEAPPTAQQVQAQAQQTIQQLTIQQIAAQQAQQQGLQMAIHQAGIQLAAQQAQVAGQVDLQQSLHIALEGNPQQVAGGVQVTLALQQQGMPLPPSPRGMSVTQQELLLHAQGADQQLTSQQGLLNLQAASQQLGLVPPPPLQRMASLGALHSNPQQQSVVPRVPEDLHPGLQPSVPSPQSLLAALPSGSNNTTAQTAGPSAIEEGKKADLMQEAISAAARGSTQKLNELIEREAQKQQQQQALAMVQAAEQHELQHQHEVKQAQMQAHHQAQQAELSNMHGGGVGVVLVEGGAQKTLQENRTTGFVDPQSFSSAQGGQFFVTLAAPTGLTGLVSTDGTGQNGGMGNQVIGGPLLAGALPGGGLTHSANLSPRGGDQLLRSLSRQHMSELGLAPSLDVGGGVNSVGAQLVMLQSVDDGAMQAERGRQEALVAQQLHSQQSVASIMNPQHPPPDVQQRSHVLGAMYHEPDTLTQTSLVGDSLGRVNEHPNS